MDNALATPGERASAEAVFSLHEKIGDVQIDLKEIHGLVKNALERLTRAFSYSVSFDPAPAAPLSAALQELQRQVYTTLVLGHEINAALIRSLLTENPGA